MIDKKVIIKNIILVLAIIITIIVSFIYYKKENDKLIFYSENEIDNNESNLIEDENLVEFNQKESNTIKVYVTGEVNKPGVKELKEGSRIEDAINLAGGITDVADISKINLAYTLEDGQKLYVPNINDEIEEYLSTENEDGIIENQGNNAGKVNINKATVEELTKLPGVGESLARRIVEYRNENGKFKTIDDLKNVSGIGDKKFESLKEYIVK